MGCRGSQPEPGGPQPEPGGPQQPEQHLTLLRIGQPLGESRVQARALTLLHHLCLLCAPGSPPAEGLEQQNSLEEAERVARAHVCTGLVWVSDTPRLAVPSLGPSVPPPHLAPCSRPRGMGTALPATFLGPQLHPQPWSVPGQELQQRCKAGVWPPHRPAGHTGGGRHPAALPARAPRPGSQRASGQAALLGAPRLGSG